MGAETEASAQSGRGLSKGIARQSGSVAALPLPQSAPVHWWVHTFFDFSASRRCAWLRPFDNCCVQTRSVWLEHNDPRGAGHRPDLSIALCVKHFSVLRLLALCASAQAVAELLLVLLLVLGA